MTISRIKLKAKLPECIFVLAVTVLYAQCEITYHVAFLGLNTSEPASVQLLSSQRPLPTASTQQNGCSNLSFTAVHNNSCISNLFPNGSDIFESQALKIQVQGTDPDPVHVNVKHNGNDEGFLAIPDDALGTEYYVATFCRFGGHCQFSVTPVDDNTSVMVRFPGDVTSSHVCISGGHVSNAFSADLPVVLNEFDVLHFESISDLTGTYVTSDKKIAVFVGSKNVPAAGGGTTSHMIEQIPPVNKWGKNFFAVPNRNNRAGDEFIIVAGTDTTEVEIRGFSPFIIPYAGQFVTRRIDWGMYTNIMTTNPVLIVQVMSVDIYNDSTSVQGTPAMVLVQSVDHFAKSYSFHVGGDTRSFLALVAETGVKDEFDQSLTWEPIRNSQMWVAFKNMSGDPDEQLKSNGGQPFGVYGYFETSRASLISMDWSIEREVCSKTAAAPGDGIDNNCNGQIDEDKNCTEKDLYNSFTLEENNQETFPIRGQDSITITLQSCGLVYVTLSMPAPSTTYFLVELAPEHIHAHICSPDCTESDEKNITNNDCNSSYRIGWTGENLTVGVNPYVDQIYISVAKANSERPETISFTSLITQSTITTAVSTKDCGKIISGEADSKGKVFYVPVKDSDTNFTIFMTSDDQMLPVSISISSLSGRPLHSHPSKVGTWSVSKDGLLQNSWGKGIRIEASEEILVYVQRQMEESSTGFHVLPKDILGTNFNIVNYPESDTNVQSAVFIAMEYDSDCLSNLTTTHFGRDTLTENNIMGRISLTKPVAIFSSASNAKVMTQMPPLETLGTKHYIPAIDLTALGANGSIIATTTEDSTIIIIRGAYDKEYIENFKEDPAISREVDDNTTMTILSSKPILVSLYLNGRNANWAAMITIPATDQYKTQHVFPVLGSGFIILTSVAVSENGSDVTSQITNTNMMSPQNMTYHSPTFSLTFVKSNTSVYQNSVFVIKSDEGIKDINRVCRLTTAIIEDGEDNDCDGLIDEEYCYTDDVPGYIDYDIDGEFNEDCREKGDSYTANGTTKFNVQATTISCSSSASPASTVSPTEELSPGPTSTSTAVPGLNYSTRFSSSHREFLGTFNPDVENTNSQDIPAPVATEPTEETCTTDCICPCGWVKQQNYTAEELREKVVEIQNKLRINIAELSAQVRRKTSAKDNRPTAIGIGYVGLAFLIVAIGSIFLLDLTSISRDIMQLRENLRDVFAQ